MRSKTSTLTADGQTKATIPTPRYYTATNFQATHNSYSGGSRGSIPEQLAAGVRFIELDINDDDFEALGDYQIGHGSPGSSVYHGGGNPQSNLFSDWLQMIVQWSEANSPHAPITLGIDMKNDLAGNSSPQDGNLSALNNLVAENLGAKLYTSTQQTADGWPATVALDDRILVVLSGDEGSRKAYRSDQGETPAVAMNSQGWVVEVHQSQSLSSGLWYWTGRYQDNGEIAWLAHGELGSGDAPAVAVNDAGQVVVVYEDGSHLASIAGQLGEKGAISWGEASRFADGQAPSLLFADLASSQVTEIHQTGGGNQQVLGTVADDLSVHWSQPAPTSTARYPTASASCGEQSVKVYTGTDSAGTDDTLLYDTPQVAGGRIRYLQLCFVEFQKGDSSQLEDDGLWFYAASGSSGNLDWAGDARNAGKVVRLWGFDQSDTSVSPPVNFPATDTPYESWYVSYCEEIGTVS